MVKIGVVTVTFNSGVVLDGFMQSMLKQKHEDWILYVIDNDSKDNTLGVLDSYADSRIQLIANKENYGVAKGNNQGIKAALADECDYVLLLNNDTEFDENLFTVLLTDLVENNADMSAPKMMYFEPNNMIWWAGGGFTKWNGMENYHKGYKEIDMGQYTTRVTGYVPTCCVLCKSELFHIDDVGLMDEKYFVYYDDTDWMLRARNKKKLILYTSNCILYHKVSSLTSVSSDFTLRMFIKNRLYYARKNFHGWYKLYALCFICLFYALSIPIQLCRRKWDIARVRLVWYAIKSGFLL